MVLIADEGKVYATLINGSEVILGKKVYLGNNADINNYYQIDEPKEETIEEETIEEGENN